LLLDDEQQRSSTVLLLDERESARGADWLPAGASFSSDSGVWTQGRADTRAPSKAVISEAA
jgi:hypothetical protein